MDRYKLQEEYVRDAYNFKKELNTYKEKEKLQEHFDSMISTLSDESIKEIQLLAFKSLSYTECAQIFKKHINGLEMLKIQIEIFKIQNEIDISMMYWEEENSLERREQNELIDRVTYKG